MDPNTPAALRATHELYCQLTGQKLSLRFDRERLWYEFLRAGFSTEDLKRVVAYLQKEIRASRRNVGALKLSNLLQLDRFEEDLNISNVRLRSAPPPQSPRSTPTDPPPPTPAQLQNLHQEAKAAFARLRRHVSLSAIVIDPGGVRRPGPGDVLQLERWQQRIAQAPIADLILIRTGYTSGSSTRRNNWSSTAELGKTPNP